MEVKRSWCVGYRRDLRSTFRILFFPLIVVSMSLIKRSLRCGFVRCKWGCHPLNEGLSLDHPLDGQRLLDRVIQSDQEVLILGQIERSELWNLLDLYDASKQPLLMLLPWRAVTLESQKCSFCMVQPLSFALFCFHHKCLLRKRRMWIWGLHWYWRVNRRVESSCQLWSNCTDEGNKVWIRSNCRISNQLRRGY